MQEVNQIASQMDGETTNNYALSGGLYRYESNGLNGFVERAKSFKFSEKSVFLKPIIEVQ